MNLKSIFKSSVASAVLFAVTMSFAPVASADFFISKIRSIVPRAEQNGDVVVQILPAENETRFTERSRVLIDGLSPGASKIMAMITTAMVLDKNITIQVDNPPTFSNIQVIQSVGLQN